MVWRFEARGYSEVRAEGKTRLKGRRGLVYLLLNTESCVQCRSTYWNRLDGYGSLHPQGEASNEE